MELGSIYRYDHYKDETHIIIIYEISEQVVNPDNSPTNCAVGINLQNSSDIRKIPQTFWKYWIKVE